MSNKVLVIGAANVDIFAVSDHEYVLHDSNNVAINLGVGGVGGNIATNLAILGEKVHFITAFGNDSFGMIARNHFHEKNVNINESLILNNQNSSIYLAIMDKQNDLYLGLNDMAITNNLDIPFFEGKHKFIDSFEFIVIDNNLQIEVITYLLEIYNHKTIIIDAVSAEKVSKLSNLLEYISILKVNELELKTLSTKRTKENQVRDLLHRGLKQIIVTNGRNDIIYKSNENLITFTPKPCNNIVNASGAGDAFISGFTYGLLNKKTTEEALELGAKLAYKTLQVNKSTLEKVNLDE